MWLVELVPSMPKRIKSFGRTILLCTWLLRKLQRFCVVFGRTRRQCVCLLCISNVTYHHTLVLQKLNQQITPTNDDYWWILCLYREDRSRRLTELARPNRRRNGVWCILPRNSFFPKKKNRKFCFAFLFLFLPFFVSYM